MIGINRRVIAPALLVAIAALVALVGLNSNRAIASDNGGLVLLNTHQFTWTDPTSNGIIEVVEKVYRGCQVPAGAFNPNDMTFEYVVTNQTYDPIPGTTNGLSGFQIIFNQSIPELYNQQSPVVGGAWVQNAFSGQFPPFAVEWDVPFGPPNFGIMPGQTGDFSFCTARRQDIVVNNPPQNTLSFGPNGWAHTWLGGQGFIFNGPNSIPGDLILSVGGATTFLGDGSGSTASSIALLAGGLAAVVVITATGWYTRRRWLGS